MRAVSSWVSQPRASTACSSRASAAACRPALTDLEAVVAQVRLVQLVDERGVVRRAAAGAVDRRGRDGGLQARTRAGITATTTRHRARLRGGDHGHGQAEPGQRAKLEPMPLGTVNSSGAMTAVATSMKRSTGAGRHASTTRRPT